jgi:hypothetical protein
MAFSKATLNTHVGMHARTCQWGIQKIHLDGPQRHEPKCHKRSRRIFQCKKWKNLWGEGPLGCPRRSATACTFINIIPTLQISHTNYSMLRTKVIISYFNMLHVILVYSILTGICMSNPNNYFDPNTAYNNSSCSIYHSV